MTADLGNGPVFSIKAAAQATGLSVETLRAWERRYRVIEPRRAASGHRVYSTHDVARLRRLRETTACGHPISKVAHLTNDQLALLLTNREPERANRSAAKMLVTRLLSAVENYQPSECEQVISLAFALLPAFRAITDVLAPALREVGSRWGSGHMSIGQERILSCAVRRKVMGVLNTYHGAGYGGSALPLIVFATLTGELHELGSMMGAALAASLALRFDYLGPDIPPEVLNDHAARLDAAVVAISVVMLDRSNRTLRQLVKLRKLLPQPVEIWVGGSGAFQLATGKIPPGIILLNDYRDFEHRVRGLKRPDAARY